MADNNNELGKELALIIKFDKEIDYKNIKSVKSLYDDITMHNTFNTILGKKYTAKLKDIIDGNENEKCVFCNKFIFNPVRTVFCPDCIEKIISRNDHPATKPLTASNHNISTNAMQRQNTPQKNKKRFTVITAFILVLSLTIGGFLNLIIPHSRNALKYIGINNRINGVILNTSSNTSLDIAGIHVGDAASDVIQVMDNLGAVYDYDNSVSGITEIYYLTYKKRNYKIVFDISDRKVTRITAEINQYTP